MQLTFNAAEIVDLVLDETLAASQLEQIAEQLYADKRGGELAHLWQSEEFLAALDEQLS